MRLPLLTELQAACRRLRREPRFVGLVVLMLGLALGGATAMFAVVSAVLLRPRPYTEPERLTLLRTQFGADARILGQDVRIEGRPFRSVGVMPDAGATPRLSSMRVHAMRLDDTAGDAGANEQDQDHRQRDATGQCVHRALAAAAIGEHVYQPGAEVVEDQREEGEDHE